MKRDNSQKHLAKTTKIKAIKRGKVSNIDIPSDDRKITQWNPERGVFCVMSAGKRTDVTCREIQEYPNLVEPFVEAFGSVYRASGLNSLGSLVQSIKAGFVRFLAFKGVPRSFSLDDIDTLFVSQFKYYLDSPNAKVQFVEKKNQPVTKTLAVRTRSTYARALIRCLQYISQEDAIHLQRLLATFENILHYRNAHKKVRGIQRLDLPQYISIANAIQIEIRDQIDSYFEGQKLLVHGRAQLDQLQPREPNSKNPFICNNAIFLAKVEKIINEQGFVGIDSLRKQTHHGASTSMAYRFFAPFYADLIVHLLNFAVLTAANLTPLLNLRFGDVTSVSRLGVPAYKIWLYKARATSGGGDGTQAIGISAGPSLAEYRANPSLKAGLRVSLEFLELWTQQLRKVGSISNQQVFIGLKVRGRGIGQSDVLGGVESTTVMRLINEFSDRHNIERFNFQSIRPTILDEIEGRTTDYRVTQEIAHHATPDTTERHYLKGYARQSYRSKIAQKIEQRSRFHSTNGKSDPRLLQGQNHAAATPGFICLDPYSSPVAGETAGRLCTAYGYCPACPLAAADIANPISVALYGALNDAIYRGAEQMEARSYFEKFGKAHQMLQAYLSAVPAEIAEKARRFSFHLPTVE
ncbi:hypothetical protein [Kordiimonas sp.]|uniref:hypothetical protein n=1 Tax=Kordiimonas sp. TaxID=1970157 RepID=UPI003A8FAFBF